MRLDVDEMDAVFSFTRSGERASVLCCEKYKNVTHALCDNLILHVCCPY